ncbi:hypothetical protein RND71_037024 [Anisodus tanguticus]|uniref:Uncharacterized protein n=1 Tax=Anisodus tanguticus TaxID=243964 RepID=A0AAE1V0W1_9SOLA|nr:hypothetical protein RND71_037024 [Anisodus tanguticus]
MSKATFAQQRSNKSRQCQKRHPLKRNHSRGSPKLKTISPWTIRLPLNKVSTSSRYYDGLRGKGVPMTGLRFISGRVLGVVMRGRVYFW